MKLNADCCYCLMKRKMSEIENCNDEEKRGEYIRRAMVAIGSAKDKETSPVVLARTDQIYADIFGELPNFERFERIKKEYNTLVLGMYPSIEARVKESGDEILLALKLAMAGNYIDFGAMGTIENDKLHALLEKAENNDVSIDEFADFIKNLKSSKKLVYLTDNCGEIVLDKFFITVLKKHFPHLEITAIVRGSAVLNDATLEDAIAVGLTEIVEVIGNGTGVAGTDLATISDEAKKKINEADMIISKGQGNFETLHGCGLNIFYGFLCKCDWFVRNFNLERFKGVFINEKNQKIKR